MSPDRPLLIYKGACMLCRRWVERSRRWTGKRIAYAPSEEVAEQFPQIPAERFKRFVVLVEPDGRISYGAEAVARSLAVRMPGRPLLWMYLHVPFLRAIADEAYMAVAEGRVGESAL